MKLSESVENYLSSLVDRSLTSAVKTAEIVGQVGVIKSLDIEVVEGEAWHNERNEKIASNPEKFGFMKDLECNVKGSITLSLQDGKTKSFYVNAQLLKKLINAKALIKDAKGEYIPCNESLTFTSNEVLINGVKANVLTLEQAIEKGLNAGLTMGLMKDKSPEQIVQMIG